MEFLDSCHKMARAVKDATLGLAGTSAAGEFIRMGADGTPTKRIDQVAEDCVVEYLRENPLCSTLISEEMGRAEFCGEKGTIFLDPIDGTFNAVVGIPFYAISIAYAQEGVVQEAYVENLATGDSFTAARGRGAFLNGKPIQVSMTARLSESAMSVYGRKFDPARVMQILQKIRRFRLLGASALELSFIGAGMIDGFIDLRGSLRVTDAAAGMLICTEGGGRVTDMNGGTLLFPDEVTIGKCLVATNGVLHGKVIEYLR
jgi:myo-inositol-1(or 4)-monophosphatase